ncbi:MAG: S-adenosylmethionine:tRNA ribosyltransferase-isomerase [Flavobacteriales bacterium]
MNDPRHISIEDFDYVLPADRIALEPSAERGTSRLLKWQKGRLEHGQFAQIVDWLPSNTALILNETKVIPARLYFQKETGAVIEIFCLDPIGQDHQMAMSATKESTWRCMIGGAKKWKDGFLSKKVELEGNELLLHVERLENEEGDFQVRFFWDNPRFSFSEILAAVGEMPLPPYIEREVEESDEERYQTVFAKREGSVAAPTAGLHFTDAILDQLNQNGVDLLRLTLHVSSGTFKPVSAEKMEGHDMHTETFVVPLQVIEAILADTKRNFIPVGTTSLRTIESLYWIGVKLLENGNEGLLELHQWDCYDLPQTVSLEASFGALKRYAEERQIQTLQGATALLIAPGYTFRVAKGLITNFHMPKSTLILLVSAIVGDDWRRIYQYALDNGFQFLSYGDSSLLLPE